MSLGKRLAHLRKQSGLSQQAFAQILGVSQATVAKHEKDVNAVTATMLLRYADYFHVSADYLLCRTHNPALFFEPPSPKKDPSTDSLFKRLEALESRITALEIKGEGPLSCKNEYQKSHPSVRGLLLVDKGFLPGINQSLRAAHSVFRPVNRPFGVLPTA